jgi:uridine phosphorylase
MINMTILNAEQAYREYMVELPEGERFTQHHIKARDEDISRYMFIPGSHLRGRRIAERLEECRVVSATRGYWVYSGYYDGVFMTVCSTGMGGPVVAIAMEELARMGADTFIRVGSSGAGQDHLGVGDIAVATATVRFGGTSNNYLPPFFPASANFELTRELVDAAARRGITVHTGVCSAGDAFYAPKDPDSRALMKKAGVIANEMESDTQFTMGHFHGWRCGAAFVLDGGNAKKIAQSSATGMTIADHATNPDFAKGEDDVITICLDAMATIAKKDAAK